MDPQPCMTYLWTLLLTTNETKQQLRDTADQGKQNTLERYRPSRDAEPIKHKVEWLAQINSWLFKQHWQMHTPPHFRLSEIYSCS